MTSLKNVEVTDHILPKYYGIFVWYFITYNLRRNILNNNRKYSVCFLELK